MKLLLFALGLSAGVLLGAEGKVIKVLPHFVDFQGRHTLSPSLYERDAYQELLRNHPEKRAGMQFEVLWKVSGPFSGPLRLRMELRGTESGSLETVEMEVKRGFSVVGGLGSSSTPNSWLGWELWLPGKRNC